MFSDEQTGERVGALALTAIIVATLVVLAPSLTGAQVAGPTNLGDADTKIASDSAGDRAGQSVASAGDVNGDGVEDLIVGVPGNDTEAGPDAGAAYVFFGPVDRDEIDLSEADVKLSGVDGGDQAGKAVAPAGDLDGDGVDDILVGAPTSDENGDDAGAAYVIHGGTWLSGSMTLAEANATLYGSEGDRAGTSVSNTTTPPANQSAVIVGAPNDDAGGDDAGAAFVVEGSVEGEVSLEDDAIAKLVGESEGDLAGSSVAGVGDVNGDGSTDVLVGAPQHDAEEDDSGAAYLVTRALPARGDGGPPEDRPGGGPPDDVERGSDRVFEVPLDRATVKLSGEAADDNAGHAVASAGDVDGDGLADVIVGAPYNDADGNDSGSAYVVHGAESLPDEIDLADANVSLEGEAANDYAGWSVASTDHGAVNCDDHDDLLVGAPGHDIELTNQDGMNAGAAYVVAGNESPSDTVSLADADATFVGESATDRAGHSVASAGDVDNDSVDDLVIGAPRHNATATNAGAAYVVQGECPTDEPGYGYGYGYGYSNVDG